ncbi:MAG: cyclodeaminase/cyclohydrolase family protein [Phycisphaeraceae bacterium]|nr:MAG: cyclodeaminase/cyclohydrolase family protein [Phycisphaeraceae bacterium]
MEALAANRLDALLDALASKTPAPGGGAVASMTGATAAALAGMVVAYSVGKKSLAEHQTLLESAEHRLREMRSEFLALADEDAAAYSALNELQRLDQDDPRRTAEEPGAIRRAIEAPERALNLSSELLAMAEGLVGRSNAHLRSDLAIAAVLAEAAAAAAAWNVRINALLLPEGERGALIARVEQALAEAKDAREHVERACG